MPTKVNVNDRTVVHAKSDGIATGFPDVCKTPSPGGPVPLPYPNVAESRTTSLGTKSVSVDGNPVMVQGSAFATSSGDEAGSAGGGVLSNVIKGKAEFVNYSFDVKFEGKPVCRLGDSMVLNKGAAPNTPPIPEVQPPAPPQLPALPDDDERHADDEADDEEIIAIELVHEEEADEDDGADGPPEETTVCDEAILPASASLIGSCPYYPFRHDNFSARHQGCGHLVPDYYLGYGYKYCVRFGSELAPKLSETGQAWLAKTRELLQRYLEGGLAKNPGAELTPASLKKLAFDTHPDAYWDAGLYNLPLLDKVKIGLTPDGKEWVDPMTRDQAYEVGKRHLQEYRRAAGEVADDVKSALKELLGL